MAEKPKAVYDESKIKPLTALVLRLEACVFSVTLRSQR
jgi:hypothetical protein